MYTSSAAILVIAGLSYGLVGYLTGNWTAAAYTLGSVALFGAVLVLARFKQYLRVTKRTMAIGASYSVSFLAFALIFMQTTTLSRGISAFVFAVSMLVGALLIQAIAEEARRREEISIALEKFRSAEDELKSIANFRSELLATLSNELRSPLTVVRNYISLLLEGAYGPLPVSGEEGLRQVFDRATDMEGLLDRYLASLEADAEQKSAPRITSIKKMEIRTFSDTISK